MEDQCGQRSELPPLRYFMLNGGRDPPPAPRRPPHNNSHRSGSCQLWALFFLFLFPVIVVIAVVCFLVYSSPEAPSLSVDGISVRFLELNASDHTIHVKMVASLRAYNENPRFGFLYRDGSRVSVVYRRTTLCQGRLPVFYQATGNSTAVDVVMEGHRPFDETLQTSLRADHDAGRVPVTLYVRAPLTLRLGAMEITGVVVNVAVSSVIRSLSTNSTLDINNMDTKYEANVEF